MFMADVCVDKAVQQSIFKDLHRADLTETDETS